MKFKDGGDGKCELWLQVKDASPEPLEVVVGQIGDKPLMQLNGGESQGKRLYVILAYTFTEEGYLKLTPLKFPGKSGEPDFATAEEQRQWITEHIKESSALHEELAFRLAREDIPQSTGAE